MSARVLLLFTLGGCAIEQTFRIDDFACSGGGPCFDAAVKDSGSIDTGVRRDAGFFPDAAPMDATPMPDAADAGVDAGQMDAQPVDAAECPTAVPLPMAGIVSDDTSMNANSFLAGGCFPGPAAPDIAYELLLPGKARELSFDLVSPDFTLQPALHLYRNTCDPADRIGCAGTDPINFDTSRLTVTDLEAGYYAVVVDGAAGSAGTFTLAANAILLGGEPCDPTRGWISCDFGSCADVGGGDYRCPTVFDCSDGFDGDGDGTIDEDTCLMPPMVTCTPDTSTVVQSVVSLLGTATDDSAIVERRWYLEERPLGGAARLMSQGTDQNQITPDRLGIFRAAYFAFDDDAQVSACSTTITSTPAGDIHVEAFWTDGATDVDLDLIMLHPTAATWFDAGLACSYSCSFDWGAPGTINNPIYRGDAPSTGVVEAIHVVTPEVGRYGIGLHAFTGPVTDAWVDVYCRGQLAQSFGPKPILNTFLWKVADIEMTPVGCNVTVLDDVVPQTSAEAQR